MHPTHAGLAGMSVVFCTCTIYMLLCQKHAHEPGNMRMGEKMSAIETNRSFAVGGLGSVVANLVSLLASWSDTRRTRRELSVLSDRELDDIGLCRGDIERIARGH